MNTFKHLTTTAFLTSMMIMAGSSFSYAMDEFDELTKQAIQLSLKEAEDRAAQAKAEDAVYEEVLKQVTELSLKDEEEKAKAQAAAQQAQAKAQEEEKAKQVVAQQNLKATGTALAGAFLKSEDQGVQGLVNIFAAFSGKTPDELNKKFARSERHRKEEQANAEKYGPQYAVKNSKIEQLIAQGKLQRKS